MLGAVCPPLSSQFNCFSQRRSVNLRVKKENDRFAMLALDKPRFEGVLPDVFHPDCGEVSLLFGCAFMCRMF